MINFNLKTVIFMFLLMTVLAGCGTKRQVEFRPYPVQQVTQVQTPPAAEIEPEPQETMEIVSFSEVVLDAAPESDSINPKQLVLDAFKAFDEGRYENAEDLLTIAADNVESKRLLRSVNFARAEIQLRRGNGAEAMATLKLIASRLSPIDKARLNETERVMLALPELAEGETFDFTVHPKQLRELFTNN
ncbi:hypothetical protein [Maridesulfovibrio sp.]|uniref:hypothetical protein n=1 Tax=Maridesulfovibrio sp. TaxID=2795000 RepID=UPI0039EF9A18